MAVDERASSDRGPNDDDLLTAVEVAELLRVTTGWVYAETRAGRLPHVPLGRYRRYRRRTIMSWLAHLEQESLAAPTLECRRWRRVA